MIRDPLIQAGREREAEMSPLSPSKLDIGMGSRVHQSSYLEPGHEADYLMPSTLPGGFFFSTNLETQPWITIDLGCLRAIGAIIVWNREDVGSIVIKRASPLVIECSLDGQIWRTLAETAHFFGGRISGSPLILDFPLAEHAQFVRIVQRNATHLHLDYIEILQHVPHLDFGRAINLLRDEDDVVTCEYIHQANNGLYSGYSTVFHDIFKLSRSGIIVRRVNLSMSFAYFKERTNADAYKLFFDGVTRGSIEDFRGVDFHCEDVHREYRDLPLARLKIIADHVFRPSLRVQDKTSMLLRESGVDPARTIAVVYRGTDKSTELTLAPITDYIDLTRQLRGVYSDYHILIQTDQEQARTAFIEAFGEDCRYFAKLPVADNATAIHLQLDAVSTIGRQQFAEEVMAAIQAVSQCAVVITHTGNVGAWIAIYKGCADRLYQFNASGNLVRPSET